MNDFASKPRGRPFESGTSGNPSGRPRGSRNRRTLELEAMLEDEGELLYRALIDKALQEGDTKALLHCIDRLAPPRRDRAVEFDLPEIVTVGDLAKASLAVLTACAQGTMSPSEAGAIMGLVRAHAETLERAEIEARLTALEGKVGK